MALQDNSCNPSLLISGDGKFNQNFQQVLKLSADICPIAVVSIIGVQSTGKSTLLNHLFETGFDEMDGRQGRNQTTKGIWVSKFQSADAKILVIDTEGSDGIERQDDGKFAKQSAILALAISNTLIINMKCENVNLNYGASLPLLQTVFEVMIRKFSKPRQVSLVFVLRDKDESPIDKLEKQLMEGMQKIWNEMTKPQAQLNVALEDYFTIHVVAMSHYRYETRNFNSEVVALRQRIITSSTSGELVPASGFAKYAEDIWDDIKEDKILNLQLNKITIAELCCHRLAEEKYTSFCKHESWLQVKKGAQSGDALGLGVFGRKLDALIDNYLSEYDEEAQYFDETVRENTRKQLTENILQVIEQTYLLILVQMRDAMLTDFKKAVNDCIRLKGATGNKITEYCTEKHLNDLKIAFAEMAIGQANWNHSNEQLEIFQRHMDAHICKLNELDEVVNQSKDLKPEQRSEIWGKLFLVGIEKVCEIILGISEEERSQIWANVVKEGIQTGGDVLRSLLEEWSKGVGHPPNIASSSTAFRHIPAMSRNSVNREKE